MAFWAGSRLKSRLENSNIITPFDEKKIDCSAYTLSMGREYYITPSEGLRFSPHIKQTLGPCVDLVDESNQLVTDLAGNLIKIRGESFSIPPGQFALLLTEEFIRMPPDIMGFISLKSHPKFRGLINVSGFHVDPGFEGHLIFSVFNAGPSTITFERGQPLFLIWISTLVGGKFAEFSRNGKAPLTDISAEVLSNVPGEMVSLDSLSKRIDHIEPKTIFFRTSGFALVYAIATVLALLLALTQLTNVHIDISLK